uniref:Uncharacterized protein n=1 Tax=Percolomonas cosmopolitus TaxID=63605 RepID=A0A7S1KRU6_9EUKA|mmetsp:Transcript_597/g.2128  ORF Transcript_597/g.2128 Transcript_597/m.2128 type:complete len:267 (+) Transcript_597:10-810(+)
MRPAHLSKTTPFSTFSCTPMKFIVAFILFIAILQNALAADKFVPPYKLVKQSLSGSPFPHEAVEFLKGFVFGLESDISANATLCLEDSQLAMHDFEAAFADLKYGFQHISVSHVQKGIQELSQGINEVNIVLKDCNATELVREIEELVVDIQQGHVLKIIIKEAVNIFHHSKELTSDFKSAIQFWEQRNFNLCGVSVGKLVGILLNYDPHEVEMVSSQLSCFVKCLGSKYDVWTLLSVIGTCKTDKKCYLKHLGEDAGVCIDKCIH